MKHTGMIRRIDDLGRVVVPKEIRRSLQWREGDPVEIMLNAEGDVVLRKYSPIKRLTDFATHYAETVHEVTGNIIMVADTERVIAVSGIEKNMYLGRPIPTRLPEGYQKIVKKTIYLNGLSAGFVVMFTKALEPTDADIKLLNTACLFMEKQLSQ